MSQLDCRSQSAQCLPLHLRAASQRNHIQLGKDALKDFGGQSWSIAVNVVHGKDVLGQGLVLGSGRYFGPICLNKHRVAPHQTVGGRGRPPAVIDIASMVVVSLVVVNDVREIGKA
eukprot:TRINITY_DN12650_c2_g2_i1.p4 TRINITY_DN12650_c2_g2~~TRINITY_DN12650_c2_g2_i1.p4  ORF type:complete len:116 (-),score=8.45 TRINITY_DN12650_c2_g2_i1:295-642(-)